MPRLKKRLGASVFLSVLSLLTIVLLLPNSRVSTQIQKIGLPVSIDHYWKWLEDEAEEEDQDGELGNGPTLVIFGDSWVEPSVKISQSGLGRNYVEIICEELNCTTTLNFASSQQASDYPAKPPAGALTSNAVHAAIAGTQAVPTEIVPPSSLPDFAAQIDSYTSLPGSKIIPTDTIYLLSFGFWDIYAFAELDYEVSKKAIDEIADVLFTGLEVLYQHFTSTHQAIKNETIRQINSSTTQPAAPIFQVIIPKVFDPTLLPGWISQRPLPRSPSSVAEQQKNAAYLTNCWDAAIGVKITAWVEKTSPKKEEMEPAKSKASSLPDSKVVYTPDTNLTDAHKPTAGDPVQPSPPPTSPTDIIERDVIYYDLPGLLLDLIIEHQLENKGLHDATGLGDGKSPFKSVYQPCVGEVETVDTDAFAVSNGVAVCKKPEEYLWWDAWRLGKVAEEMIGKEIAEMVKESKA